MSDNDPQKTNSKPEQKNLVSSSNENNPGFPVVGIGASAGGLEALQEFFKNLQDNPGVAFVVVQHLSPDFKSMMDKLLARFTNMKIYRVEDGMKIEANSVYLIPPRKNMTTFHGKLYLSEQENQRPLNLPIDVFLRSLAKDQGKNAIGIILSGTGSDGTLGIRAIKEHAGMVMVQDDHSAKFDGMPRSSIATGIVDYILPPHKMPQELVNFLKHPFIQKTEKLDDNTSKENYLSKIAMLIRDRKGVDFSFYKESTVIRRLEKRVSINQFSKIEDYIDYLYRDERELNILYKELLIGVTRFFRDEQAYEQVKTHVIPEIVNKKDPKSPLRVWVAGSSTGEEAYSLAILLREYMDEHNIHLDTKIFATDLDKDSVEFASAGIYSESIISDISSERLAKYFTRKEDRYQVGETIRSMVVFASHNVLKDPPFSKIDLVSCRNLMIYLNAEVQQKLLSMFYYSLNENGFLFLGSSESVGEMSKGFKVFDPKWKIYSYLPGYQARIENNFAMPPQPKEKEKSYSRPQTGIESSSVSKRLEQVFDELVGQFVPPSAIVDERYQIVHTVSNINKYLELPEGQVTYDILKMLPNELAVLVSSMLRKVQKEKKRVVYENIQSPLKNTEASHVDIHGQFIRDRQTREIYYIISFEEKQLEKTAEKPQTESMDVGSQYQERIMELEKELQYTKESLQATNEELETSNEELQSSNEELIASNEELQSTNEELQSVNEELYTVNSEHQKKIEELTELNNDMHNLLINTNIGSLFLDKKLQIRKFTELVPQITHIRDIDVGRPIRHIAVDRVYREFMNDIDYVVETLNTKEVEIQDPRGNWFLVRIQPYRTQDYAVDGIIVTFIDITNLKHERSKVEVLNKRLEQAMAMGHLAWWEWNYKENHVSFGRQKAEMLGYKPENTGKDYEYWTNLLHPDDYERVMQAMRDHLSGKNELYEARYRIKAKDGSWKWYLDRGGIVERDEENKPLRITGIVMDISREKAFEQEKNKTYELIHQTLEYNPVASTIVDKSGFITFANKQAEKLLGITQKQIKERSFDDMKWENTDLEGNPIPSENLPFSIVCRTKKPIYRYQHYIKKPGKEKMLLSINGAPMLDGNGAVKGVVFTLEDVTEEEKMERALRESEKKFRSLFKSNRDAILMADSQRYIIDANPAFEQLLGYSIDELKGKKTSSIYGNEADFKTMGEALTHGNKDAFLKTIRYKRKDKSLFYGETSVFQLTDDDGNLEANVALIRDITDDINRIQALKDSEARFRSYIENSPISLFIVDKQGNIEFASPYGQRFLGYTLEQLKEMHINGLEEENKAGEIMKALSQKELLNNKELNIRLADGERRHILLSAAKLPNDYFLVYFTDIQHKIKLEEKISREKKVLEHTFDAVMEGIVLLDDDYTIQNCNQVFADLIGQKPGELVGQKAYKVLHGTDKPPDHCFTCHALKEQRQAGGQIWEPHLNKTLELTIAPVYDEAGNFEFAVQTVREAKKSTE